MGNLAANETDAEPGPPGLLLFVGIGKEDDASVIEPMAKKIANLRIMEDADGKMNRSILDLRTGADLASNGADILAVSQFTLYADCKKGRRPSFVHAAAPDVGKALFDDFVEALRAQGLRVATGRFGAMMDVHLVNDGPVTIWLDSDEVLPGVARRKDE